MTRDYSIEVVKRAFEALEILASSDTELSGKDIAHSLRVSLNSAFRLLFTLEELGYIWKEPSSKKYSLGIELFRLGNAALKNRDIRHIAWPFLKELLNIYQETVNLAVLQEMRIIYIERLESPRSLRTSNTIGSVAPAYSTSLGKAMLAFSPTEYVRDLVNRTKLVAVTPNTITDPKLLERELEITRQRGYALDAEENVIGVYCISAPIFSYLDHVEAAISISSPAQRLNDPNKRQDIGVALMRVAQEISQRLGSLMEFQQLSKQNM